MHLTRRNWFFALQLVVACTITWFLSSSVIYGLIDIRNEMLGSMWAVIATIFVLKESHGESLKAALVRIAATLSSVAVCFLYFLVLPFNPLGMVVLIGTGYLIANALGRPEDAVTTGITIAVVMVVGGLEPATARTEPLFRLFDTLVGSAVAIAIAWGFGRFTRA